MEESLFAVHDFSATECLNLYKNSSVLCNGYRPDIFIA